MGVAVVVLAAGKGTRMKSDLPKVLHEVAGRPMVLHVLDTVRSVRPERIIVVTGYRADDVESAIAEHGGEDVEFVRQAEQLGTGHAVIQAESLLASYEGDVVVLNGDVPGLSAETLRHLLAHHSEQDAVATVLTARIEDPSGYGRIVRDEGGHVRGIVEHRDATRDVLEIDEINSGLFCFKAAPLFSALKQTNRLNAQNEYYLTDVIALFNRQGQRVSAYCTPDSTEIVGVNDAGELDQVRKLAGEGE